MSWPQWSQPVPVQAPPATTAAGTSALSPSYSASQFSALTAEQQYAFQQNWQQWQQYHQQYAQWHAQYGEQYQREMQAKLGVPPPGLPFMPATAPFPAPALPDPPPPAGAPAVSVANTALAPPVVPPPAVPPPTFPTASTYAMPGIVPTPVVDPKTMTAAPPPLMGTQLNMYNVPPPPPPTSASNVPQSSIYPAASQPPPPPPPEPASGSQQYNRQNESNNDRSSYDNQYRNSNYPSLDGRKSQNNREQNNFNRNDRRSDFNDRYRNEDRNYNRNYGNKAGGQYQRNTQQRGDSFQRTQSGDQFARSDSYQRNDQYNRNEQYQREDQSQRNDQFQQVEKTSNQPETKPTEKDDGDDKLPSEKIFDEQFQKWEQEFENWKKQNWNHPDKAAYREYERKFEECRRKLLERREQMRRRKLDERMSQAVPRPSGDGSQEPNSQPREPEIVTNETIVSQQKLSDSTCVTEKDERKSDAAMTETCPAVPVQDQNPVTSGNDQKFKNEDCTEEPEIVEQEPRGEEQETDKKDQGDEVDSKSSGFLAITKSGEIPGLDLVQDFSNNIQEKKVEEKPRENIDIIDLDAPAEDENIREAPQTDESKLNLPLQEHIQMQQQQQQQQQSLFQQQQQQFQQQLQFHQQPQFQQHQQVKEIPSLLSQKIEPPTFSPEEREYQMGQSGGRFNENRFSNDRNRYNQPPKQFNSPPKLSPNESKDKSQEPHSTAISELANALSDPNVLALLTAALNNGGLGNVNLAGLQQQAANRAKDADSGRGSAPFISPWNAGQEPFSGNRSFNQFGNNFGNRSSLDNRGNFDNRDNYDNRGGGNTMRNNPDLNWTRNFKQDNNNRNNRQNPLASQDGKGDDDDDGRRSNTPSRSESRFGKFSDQRSSRDRDCDLRSRNNSASGSAIGETSKSTEMDVTHSGQTPKERSCEPDDRTPMTNVANPFKRNNSSERKRPNPFGGDRDRSRSSSRTSDTKKEKLSIDRDNRMSMEKDKEFLNEDERSMENSNRRFNPNNPFKRGNFNMMPHDKDTMHDMNAPPPTNLEDDYFRPTQVIDYGNRSLGNYDDHNQDTMFPTKVVEYGHKPSNQQQLHGENKEFIPFKTIDYGHSSSGQSQNQNQNQNQNNIHNNNNNRQVRDNLNNNLRSNRGRNNNFQRNNYNKKSGLDDIYEDFSTRKMGRIWNNQLNQSGNFLNQNQLNVGIDVDSNYNEQQLYHHYVQQQQPHQNQQKHQQHQYQYQLDQQEYHHENFNYNNIKRFDHSNDFRRYNPLQPPPPPSMINFSSHTTNNPLNKNLDELSDDDIESSNNFDDSKDRPAIFPIIPMEMKADAYRVIKNDEICDPDPLNPLKNDHENIQNNNIISIDEILMQPGRISRPSKLVVILRGPPGSGKTHVAKLIKKFEVEMGGSPPRILSIDDYFMTEIEKEEKCPKTGRKIVKKEMEYEYEKAMEPTYMQYLIKAYKKTLTDGLFDFIIVDSVNSNIKTINEYHDLAKTNRFMPYIIELDCNLDTCLNQNVHKRSEEDIQNIIGNWDSTPSSYIKLDIKSLLQREAIQEVEMDDISETDEKFPNDEESDDAEVPETSGQFGFLKSKWDTDTTDLKLARLDGISKPMNKSATLEDYLQMDGWEPPPSSSSSKKRVRWADIEEKREQDKMRAIGFVVGQTDWNRMMDTTDGSSALTKTKYIEKIKRN